jgi:hypothetical protein
MLPLTKRVAFSAAIGLVGLGACTSDQGQTPSCTFNVDQNGINPESSGCEQFAVCAKPDPAQCCVDVNGNPLTGSDLTTCLFGYGVVLGDGSDGGAPDAASDGGA